MAAEVKPQQKKRGGSPSDKPAVGLDEAVQAHDALMASGGIENLSNVTAIEKIGSLIDLSDDLKSDEGTRLALAWCDTLQQRALSHSEAVLLHYFRANAWGNRQKKIHSTPGAASSWEQPNLQEQVLHLRRAVVHPGFEGLDRVRRCQIFTNLGNLLNNAGRFVEALEYWERALAIEPRFGMALGNRGYALRWYAKALYDNGHKALFLRFAHDSLNAALSPSAKYKGPGYGEAKAFFQTQKARIESIVDIDKISRTVRLDEHVIGDSKEEKRYRRWLLRNHLFLNPLDDLGPYAIAGGDILMLPSFVTPIEEPPTLIGLFNQLKQEFVSARWLFYEGAHAQDFHFSDRDVLLLNTLDYPSYSLAVEKVKAAYGIAYSLFDKIALFLSAYLGIEIDSKSIYFRSIWYEKYEKRVLRSEFAQSENWPFRGLFWLSKDLFEEEFRDVTEPDAQALYEIRNHLEHKYLKVHEMMRPQPDPAWADRLAYSIERQDFIAKTLRVLRLVRASLIYLSLGMHREERRRAKQNGGIQAPMYLDAWEDDLKR
jgi:hypothetical protein